MLTTAMGLVATESLVFGQKKETTMYGLIGKMNAQEGKIEDLLAALLTANDTPMPGCLSYIVARDPADANGLWITEVWDSKESHAASLNLPQVKKLIASARPWIAGFSNRTETIPAGGYGLKK